MTCSAVGVVRHPLPWILLLALLLRLQVTGHLRSSDDLVYAQAAAELLEGSFDPATGSFHRLRSGLILPTAAAFACFGVSPGASILWPLASSLGSIALLYAWVRRRAGASQAAWAALLTAVGTQHALSGAELFPDAPLLLWSMLALALYWEARELGGRPWAHALAGAALYLAATTRIEALKLLPWFVLLEAWQVRRRGWDRAVLWLPGVLLGALALDSILMGGCFGDAALRLRELSPAVEGWAASPAARDMGAWTLVKSFLSPFGAFGLAGTGAIAGALLAIRRGRGRLPAATAAFLLGAALLTAARYRIADGRHLTLLTPFVAWLAASALEASGTRAWILGGALAFSGIVCFHARLTPDLAEAYRRLEATVRSAPGPVETDRRTLGALRLYHPAVHAVPAGGAPAGRPGWIADNVLLRGIDARLYGPDASPLDAPGEPVAVVPVRVRGLPILRRLLHRIVPDRVPAGESVSEIRLHRR